MIFKKFKIGIIGIGFVGNAIKTVLKEKTNEPKTPDNVLLGLIFVNFFHLNNFPNTYPPISELTVIVIAQNNNTKDEVVSFLKNKIESSDDTKITSKNIIENFFLNTENTSKLPKIRTAYKKDTK